MRITFLIHNVYGIGGTNRTIVNLATELSRRHRVEIVSVFRRLDRPMFEIPSRIRVTPLVDTRPGRPDRDRPLLREPSALVPADEEFFPAYSRLTDERIVRHLRDTPADVVVGTRPALNLMVARFAPAGSVRVAQEHMTQDLLPETVRAEIREHYHRIHCAQMVTAADAERFRRDDPVPGLAVVVLPNSVPAPTLPPASGTSPIIVAAGRLDRIKRYDLLVRAFARIAPDFPQWRLRIYGDGPEGGALRALAAELSVHEQVLLMGRRGAMEAEWAKGSIAAVTSARESFGMTVVEAMRNGLPVVSTACPVGPPEIIRHGGDGLLCEVGDVTAIAAALRSLVADPDRRRRMGDTARENAARFDPAAVAARFEEQVEAFRVRATGRRGPRVPAGRSAWRSVGTAVTHAPALLTPEGRRTAAAPLLDLMAATTLTRRVAHHVVRPALAVPPWEPPAHRLQAALSKRALAAANVVADCDVAEGAARFRIRAARQRLRLRSLVLIPVRTEPRDDTPVEVPLHALPDGRTWQAAVSRAEVTEGHWRVCVRVDAHLHRLRPGHADLRDMVTGAVGDGPLARMLPGVSPKGYLALWCWFRDEHAELDRVDIRECGGITLTGRVAPGTTAGTELLLIRESDRSTVRVPVAVRDGRFHAEVPLDAVSARRLARDDEWTVWLTSPRTGRPVRMSRLLTDIPDRSYVHRFPAVSLDSTVDPRLMDEWPPRTLSVRPRLTALSNLSIHVREH